MTTLSKNNFKNDYEVITTTNPEDVYQIISDNQTSQHFHFFSNQTQETYNLCYDTNENLAVGFDFNKIINFIENKELSNSVGIGVVVVDYKMPQMNGVELCKIIREHYHSKTILLTAEAGSNDAIDAFNNKLIDGYIRKNEHYAINKLKLLVKSVLNNFFIELSLPILNSLEAIGCSHITDPIFIKFFHGFLCEHNIREYYLVNLSWVYIMFDTNGNKFIFIVQDENDLRKNFIEIYEDINEVEDVINLVKDQKYIPYFGINKEPLETPLKEWHNHIHQSNQVQSNNKTYYWTFIAA